MRVRTVKEFYDREAGVPRKAGDEFEAGDARVASLVHSLYGVLVELVPDKPTKRPRARASTRKAAGDGD